MSMTLQTTVSFETQECIKCGVTFAITTLYEQERRRDHASFYCPNGHGQLYPGKSDVEQLREEKARLTHQLDQERAAKMTALQRAEKAERKVKRAEKGVCPHCNRSFRDLARHMECKHAKVKA